MSQRIFLAIDLDADMRRRLYEVASGIDAAAKMNVVAQDNLHVTLMFLGDVDDNRLSDVCNLASSAVGRVRGCDFDVRGVKLVPPAGAPRMIWGCVDDPSAGLTRIYNELDAALLPLGLRREERQYRPHITLARIKHVRSLQEFRHAVAVLCDQDFGPARAGSVTLYSSLLTPSGPIYTPLGKFPLS